MTSKLIAYHQKRSSLDRFGDDLCDLIFRYLDADQRFAVECVSKQWQQLVFRGQTDLQIGFINNFDPLKGTLISLDNNHRNIDLISLETILKKCKNIYSVYLHNYQNRDQLLELIIKFCNVLISIDTNFDNISINIVEDFCHKFGPQIKTLTFELNNDNNKEVLKKCPNVSTLAINQCRDMSIVFDGQQVLVNKLKSISFAFTIKDIDKIEKFIDNNLKTLDTITVDIGLIQNQYNILFEELSKVRQLKTLSIKCEQIVNNSFVDALSTLSNNSLNLKSMKILTETLSVEIIGDIYHSMNEFKQLKRLDLRLICFFYNLNDIPDVMSCGALRNCHQLTHLTLSSNICLIKDNFFDDIDKHLPHLQHICCENTNLLDQTFISLSKLSALKCVDIRRDSSDKQIDESVIINLCQMCLKLKSIYFSNDFYFISLKSNEISILKERDSCKHSCVKIIHKTSQSDSDIQSDDSSLSKDEDRDVADYGESCDSS